LKLAYLYGSQNRVEKSDIYTGVEQLEEPEPSRELPQEKITLRARDEKIRTVLRIMAQEVEEDVVMSDNIQGTMDINIDQKPWDQAFQSILRTYGLTYSWEGDIIRVQSLADIKRETELEQAQTGSQPLQTTVIDVNYAHIVDTGMQGEDKGDLDKLQEKLQNLLDNMAEDSKQGRVFVDRENNALIIQATEEDTERVLHVFRHLDRPREQIHIEASIVEATRNTAREMGMRWSGRYITPLDFQEDVGIGTPLRDEAGYGGDMDLSLISARLPGSVLYAQLQALEREGKINILSTPSLTTMDNQMAFTEHGQKVPYETEDEDGDRTVEFENVALKLEVLPRVINGDEMAMRILVTKDEVDFSRDVRGNPLIRQKQTETNLVVGSGETIVISGLTKQTSDTMDTGVPGLKNLPGLGWLFKDQDKSKQMEEFMVFITPTVLGRSGN
ncbi:MAG: secretin N-terminal domain-containing protein, partial [Desulfohalobiaceae bacterium]